MKTARQPYRRYYVLPVVVLQYYYVLLVRTGEWRILKHGHTLLHLLGMYLIDGDWKSSLILG